MENQCLICLGIFLWSNNHLITSNMFIVVPVQEMTFTFGELVIGTLCRLHACKVKV